jgi:hypothetical protein
MIDSTIFSGGINMSKLVSFLSAAVLALGMAAQAQASVSAMDFTALQNQTMAAAAAGQGLQWHVNDKATYKLDGGFIQGTIASFVREDGGTFFWLQQDADLGFMGKQKIEVQMNKADGKVLKILANGQEQQIPDASDQELGQMKEDHIKVPAGEFDCIYVQIKSKKDGSITEAWINPKLIPITGALKQIAPSQFGKISQELVSFEFAH